LIIRDMTVVNFHTTMKLVIGWIGSPSTEKYVVKIKTALMAVCENYGARVVLMGASPGVIAELDGLNVEVCRGVKILRQRSSSNWILASCR